jgi:hypothetical protein
LGRLRFVRNNIRTQRRADQPSYNAEDAVNNSEPDDNEKDKHNTGKCLLWQLSSSERYDYPD